MQIFSVSTEIYGFSLKVVIEHDLKAAVAYISKFDKECTSDFLKGCNGAYFEPEKHPAIIWLPKNPETPKEYGTLSHEVLHAVIALSRIVGLTLSEDSEEAFTYLQGYITEQILKKIK